MPSLAAVIIRGARAAQPAANSVAEGALYYVTDENVTERSNGSTWDSYNDASGAATDHGLLTGLADDDHTQYLLASQATDRATFTSKWADLTAGPDSNLVDANVVTEPWEFVLPGTGITVTIEGDSGSAIRLAVDSSAVVTTDSANWVDLTDGGATTLHSHSGGAYDSTATSGITDFVEASDSHEPWELLGLDSIQFIIDGGGSAITTGVKGDLRIPFNCTILSATLMADQSGSIVIDIWKDSLANFPPTVADTITASAKPTLSSATNSEDKTLTGWTTTINSNDTLRFNVDSATTVTRVTLALMIIK